MKNVSDSNRTGQAKVDKGHSSVSTTEYTSFDIMGRVTGQKQTTDGTAYTTGYTYKLNGALDEETYPSGRVVKNVLTQNGDLSIVESKKNSTLGFFSYAKNFTYTAAGAVGSMQLGNGKWESTAFNSRLQPTQIALGTTRGTTDKLKLNFDYGTTANNGNIQNQTITVAGTGGFTAVQNYNYDSLNRLQAADEKPYGWIQSQCTSTPSMCWKQTFTYDRYGNRRFDEPNTTMPSSFANQAVTDPTISTTNNRLTSTGFLYDNAGNTTRDALYQTFTYDAENKQTEVKNSSSVSLGQYWYDGDGKRIKKYVPGTGETTIFVYDAAGKQIAEYSTIVEGSSTAKVNYLTNDHLGSPRINTDANGTVIARHDYHPFGEEINGTGGRTTGLNYGSDAVRKQFTGYERDNETELNYAKARYQNPNLGRFSSPDPARMTKARMADPQHWNLYVYARNNPILLVDITGEFPWTFYVRSFIQTSTVAGGTVAGDGRSASLETDGSVTSRIRLNFTLDYDRGRITNDHIESDWSTFHGIGGVGGFSRKGDPQVQFSEVSTYNRSKGVSLDYSGQLPLTPSAVTPAIDVHANIAITESKTKYGNGTLFINGTFTGDKFPSTEAFIVDQSGKTKLFLGAKLEQGGPSDLMGDNKEDLFKVDFQVKFDRKGNFNAVIQDGKTYSVDAWNRRVQAQF